MQHLTTYEDIVQDVKAWLLHQTKSCHATEVWFDPGIGFAKNVNQNLRLLQELRELTTLNHPILLGTSRKSFIGTPLNQPRADDRLIGSLATVADGWYKGVRAFRVHDVKETKELLDMLQIIHG